MPARVQTSPLLTIKDQKRATLDPNKRSIFIEELEKELSSSVIGQDEALQAIADSMSRVVTGIRNHEKPILSMLFLGPTGVGKTEVVKVISKCLFGDRSRFVRINCQELSESHTVAKLLGSPPGYVGGEIEPLLSEESLIRGCEEAWVQSSGIYSKPNPIFKRHDPANGKFLSIVLFDEIEKAHPKIWTTLLGLMDDGHLILSNNEKVDFTDTIIIMTTNVGSRELDSRLSKNSIGFNIIDDNKIDYTHLDKQAKESVSQHFPPEFVNRFNHIIGFKPLDETSISKILEIQIENFYKTLLDAGMPITFNFSREFKKHIINIGTSQQYGARHLNRKIEETLITPVSKMVSSEQIIAGDEIYVTIKDTKINFVREKRTEEQMKSWHKIKKETNKKPRAKNITTRPRRPSKNSKTSTNKK